MKATLIAADSVTLPRFDNVTNEDVLTPMVEITVQYDNDDDTLHSTQKYAYIPDGLPNTAEEIQAMFDARLTPCRQT